MFKFAESSEMLRRMVDKTVRNHDKGALPNEFKDEKAVFENMILTKGRENAVKFDAKSLAMLMLSSGKHDPTSVMDSSSWWQFIKRFHVDYYNDVVALVKNMITYHSAELQKMIPAVVPNQQGGAPGSPGGMGGPPPPPPPDAGGAMPPPMASTNKLTKEAKLYIYRHDKHPHKLIGSLASDIVAGKQQFLDKDGMPFVVRTTSGSKLILSFYSPTARAALKLNDELPVKIQNEILACLREHSIEHAEDIAKATYSRIRKNKNFDLLPVSLQFMPCSDMIQRKKAAGQMEPHIVHELRCRLGLVMKDYIYGLLHALKTDGIEFIVIKGFLPSFTLPGAVREADENHDRKIHGDKPIKSDMKVLEFGEARSSSDVRSLMMTISTGDSKTSKVAAIRLCELVCKNADIVDQVGLTPSDINALAKTESGQLVGKAVALTKLDESQLASKLMEGDELDQYLIACVIASTKKWSILAAMPEIVLAGNMLHPDLLEKLSVKDPEALKIMKHIIATHSHKYRALIERKLIGFLSEWTKDNDLVNLTFNSEFNAAKCFIMAKMLEQQTPITSITPGLLFNFKKDSVDPDCLVLLAVALCKHPQHQLIKSFYKTFKLSPMSIQMLAGKHMAKVYMKANRITWDGGRVPSANEIFNSPDNPMNLASSLSDIDDDVGLLALLHTCGQKLRSGDKTLSDTVKFIVKKFDEKGMSERAYAVTNSLGIQVDDLGTVLDEDASSPEKIIAHIKAGNVVEAAAMLCKIYMEDEEVAKAILEVCPKPSDPKTFLELLPLELTADSILPNWAKSIISHSFVLPNGIVVSGTNGMYRIQEAAFASSSRYALSSAINMVGRGIV